MTATVLVLGVFHLDNPGQDLVNLQFGDILGARRQTEIAGVVERLAGFQPTKIALESLADSSALHDRYMAWSSSAAPLTADEIDQFGLRLARRLGHAQVYPIDVAMPLDFDALGRWAQEHGQGTALHALFESFAQEMQTEADPAHLEALTMRELLLAVNTPEWDTRAHRLYMQLLAFGAGTAYPGAELVAHWYERNLKIAANIQRLATPGERVLVVIGAGHAKLLREFLAATPGIEVRPVSAYLAV